MLPLEESQLRHDVKRLKRAVSRLNTETSLASVLKEWANYFTVGILCFACGYLFALIKLLPELLNK